MLKSYRLVLQHSQRRIGKPHSLASLVFGVELDLTQILRLLVNESFCTTVHKKDSFSIIKWLQ